MTTQPTRDQLRALEDKATEGPWEVKGDGLSGTGVAHCCMTPDAEDRADMKFIAAARTALPALLDALDQAEARLAGWMEHWNATARTGAVDEVVAILEANARADHAVAVYQQRAREAEAWARLWKETARRAIRGERVLFRVNRQAREQMGRERGHLFRVAAERNDATERAEQAEARIQAVRELHHHDVFRGHLDNGCAICGHDWPCPTIRALDGEA